MSNPLVKTPSPALGHRVTPDDAEADIFDPQAHATDGAGATDGGAPRPPRHP